MDGLHNCCSVTFVTVFCLGVYVRDRPATSLRCSGATLDIINGKENACMDDRLMPGCCDLERNSQTYVVLYSQSCVYLKRESGDLPDNVAPTSSNTFA